MANRNESIHTPVTFRKVKAGGYELLNAKGEVVGYVEKRYRGWYGEMVHTSESGAEFFHNQCGDSRADVMDSLDYLNHFRMSYLKGRGKDENKSSVARLKEALTTQSWAK